jgi:hypothetical protein
MSTFSGGGGGKFSIYGNGSGKKEMEGFYDSEVGDK